MMSSLETSSPVSASTFAYLMRWPVFRLIWLKLIFSESEVAGYKATGQVTSERRKKPFQLARGAIQNTPDATENSDSRRTRTLGSDKGWRVFLWRLHQQRLLSCSCFVLMVAHTGSGLIMPTLDYLRNEIEHMRR